ncbi:glycosyltransferase family 90 protein, partial [Tortispora caseinolytica NRRL Y-17796]
TLEEYVDKYIKDHGRAPPPGFDKWYEFSINKGCVDFDHFDAIYEDLELFWNVKPADIRAASKGLDNVLHLETIKITNGVSSSVSTHTRVVDIRKMMAAFTEYLPDMELVVNLNDEPRVFIPYEDILRIRGASALSEISGYHPPLYNDYTHSIVASESPDTMDIPMEILTGKELFSHASDCCAPDSPLRLWQSGRYNVSDIEPMYKSLGLVTNYSLTSDLCTVAPLINDKHGFLVAPVGLRKIQKLVPVFSMTKTSINYDIRIPGDKYHTDAGLYGYDGTHDPDWDEKKEIAMWRGVPSGGQQRLDSYMKVQRNRLIHLLNASFTDRPLATIFCDNKDPYATTKFTDCQVNLTEYLKTHADAGFSSLECLDCEHLADIYDVVPKISSTDQYKDKYVIDVDGHSFSARFKAFLQSKSLPFKASIFKEWHDSRLIPWLHFIPMDNALDDTLKLLTYFTGVEGVIEPHQDVAKQISLEGRMHADLVLRNEDVESYMFLLFLEYARLLDDNRDQVGF